MRLAAAALLAAVVAAGCADNSEKFKGGTDAVLYTIGLSTDPYGESSPEGFGVATGVEDGKPDKVEVHQPGLGGFGGADWLDRTSILVPQHAPPFRAPLIYRYDARLSREGAAPFPAGASHAWSSMQRLFAYTPPEPCGRRQRSLFACYRSSGRIFVVRKDGSKRREVTHGHVGAWIPDGRIGLYGSDRRATARAFDLRSGRAGPVLPGWRSELPIWSSDRRFVAAKAEPGIVVARADGTIVQKIPSKIIISMITWSPKGEQLAYTTSGFPDPHELFVLDSPDAKPRLLYEMGDMHFDWITWSPDGTRLLLDEEHMNRWLLLDVQSGERRELPRLGGRPLWCCPVNPFESLS